MKCIVVSSDHVQDRPETDCKTYVKVCHLWKAPHQQAWCSLSGASDLFLNVVSFEYSQNRFRETYYTKINNKLDVEYLSVGIYNQCCLWASVGCDEFSISTVCYVHHARSFISSFGPAPPLSSCPDSFDQRLGSHDDTELPIPWNQPD